jgi:gamma-D-glutamyl-L-lysine dipeptidyl-peptidase
MFESINTIIEKLAHERADDRVHIFNIEVAALEDSRLSLRGRVLEAADLEAFNTALSKQHPSLRVDASGVSVLRQPGNVILSVGTNLTSTHTSTSFGAEQTDQLVFGEKVEVLEEKARWVYVRQMDGYLSWTYRPYLSDSALPEATHIVMAPAMGLRSESASDAPVVTRLFSGTHVKLEKTKRGWAQVVANKTGWMPLADLHALDELPKGTKARRAQIVEDSKRMIGVPYLWGGTTGNGIDCSGFARLLHAWVGVEIPRDADMQCNAARPVKPPFHAGDLLFFGEGDSDRHITHVGVSLGGWTMIHSSRAHNGVYIDNVQQSEGLRSIFVSAGTFIGK